MEYKNQTENRAFQEMLQAAVKRLQNRSGEDIAALSGYGRWHRRLTEAHYFW